MGNGTTCYERKDCRQGLMSPSWKGYAIYICAIIAHIWTLLSDVFISKEHLISRVPYKKIWSYVCEAIQTREASIWRDELMDFAKLETFNGGRRVCGRHGRRDLAECS